MSAATDRDMMTRALVLAERGLFTTTPNPRVGCVIARDSMVLGEGWHECAGGAMADPGYASRSRQVSTPAPRWKTAPANGSPARKRALTGIAGARGLARFSPVSARC